MSKNDKNKTEVKTFTKSEAIARLAILDERLGEGIGADKERAKCKMAIDKDKS